MSIFVDLPGGFIRRIVQAIMVFAAAAVAALLDRPIAAISLLAFGVFLVVGAVAIYRADRNKRLREEWSRTKGVAQVPASLSKEPLHND